MHDKNYKHSDTVPFLNKYQANAHLREFLADLFGVAKSQVTLLAGETGRDKRLRIAAPKQLPPGIAPPVAA